jgi:phospholipid/cholesterol/gamma-HCH transport system substrate-binding protein
MAGDIPQLTKKLNVIAGNFEDTSAKLKELDVQKALAGVDATLANVQTMTDDLNKKMNSKDNNIGLMLNDRSIYDNLNAATANAASLMKDLQENPKRYVHFSVWGKSDKKKKSE